MTFADLLTTLETRAALPASRVKDMKTSLRYLAHALGQPGLDQASVEGACRDPAAWTAALETHFQALEAQGKTIRAATRRNTRNNLRVVFRLAEAQGLLAALLPSPLLTKTKRRVFMRQQRETALYQSTYAPQTGPRRFGLHQTQWPPDIAQGWREYQAKCGLRIRESTWRGYVNRMTTYLGYFTTICGRTPTWDNLFDVTNLAAFVRWQGARVGRSVSIQGHQMAQMIGAIAVVLKDPRARALADFRNELPTPSPLHIKRVHWVPLATLEAVAEACLIEGRGPFIVEPHIRNPGVRRATQFQRGVMLKLLVRVPLRQRNVREMQLGKHLAKDPQTGHWHLEFRGDDLKIGTRGGRVNEYKMDLTKNATDFIPVLEEFLQVYRPRLPNPTGSPLLFLSHRGKPFSAQTLGPELSRTVAMRTGQRFYPHLIRTIWATEYLEATQDFTGAAVMLGDTIGVVMRTYHDVVTQDYHAKAKAFLATALQG
jgi:hypothetical protein